jgi:hypothetical protein
MTSRDKGRAGLRRLCPTRPLSLVLAHVPSLVRLGSKPLRATGAAAGRSAIDRG